MTEPTDEWKLRLLMSAAIEYVKLEFSEVEASKKAFALLKECEKRLQGDETESKPTEPQLSKGLIPINFEELGREMVALKKAIAVVTTVDRVTNEVEERFWKLVKEVGVPYYEDQSTLTLTELSSPKELWLLDYRQSPQMSQDLLKKSVKRRPLTDQELADTKKIWGEDGCPAELVTMYQSLYPEWWAKDQTPKRKKAAIKGLDAKREKRDKAKQDEVAALRKTLEKSPPAGKSREVKMEEAIKEEATAALGREIKDGSFIAKTSNVFSICRSAKQLSLKPQAMEDLFDQVLETIKKDLNPKIKWLKQ